MKVYDNVEYKNNIKSLSGEYKDCYLKIENYIKICFSGNNAAEEKCIYQILDELTFAQSSRTPVSMVIGKNLKEYCDKYIQLNQTPNEKFINKLQTTALYTIIILILMFVKSYKLYSSDFANNLSFGVLEVLVIIYAFVWNVIRLNITRFALKNNKRIKNLDIYINIVFILILYPIINFSAKLTSFEIKIPLILFIIIIAIVVLTYVYINKRRKAEIIND